MSIRDPARTDGSGLESLAKNLQDLQEGGSQMVGLFARSENFRHVRHQQLLERWAVVDEAWALEVETARKAAIDRTPGAATFGR